MSCYNFSALPVSLCSTFLFDTLCASGGQMAGKRWGSNLARLLLRLLHWLLKKASNGAKVLPNHLLQGSLSSAQWSHICETFTQICSHTHTIGISFYYKSFTSRKPHTWGVGCFLISFSLSLFLSTLLSFSISHRSSWRASKVASSMLMTETSSCRGGFTHMHAHAHTISTRTRDRRSSL